MLFYIFPIKSFLFCLRVYDMYKIIAVYKSCVSQNQKRRKKEITNKIRINKRYPVFNLDTRDLFRSL